MNETMQREIRAQAEVLPACLDPLGEAVAVVPKPDGRVFAGGCGDSAFAPAALGEVFRSLDLDVRATTAMELAGYSALRPTDTVILSSISGGTKRTVEAALAARRAGARVVGLTCGANSDLAGLADHLILLPFTPISRKTPHTLDYLVTLQALAILALAWAGRDPRSLGAVLQNLPGWIATAEVSSGDMLARLGSAKRFVFLGGGPDLATAAYAAAKLHEAGGLPAVSAESENFIHGMNFTLEPHDGLIAVATCGMSRTRGLEVCRAYEALGVLTWCLTSEPSEPSDPLGHVSALFSATLALQLFCLNLANRLGLDLERPRAGRPHGDEHLRLQTQLMKTDLTRPPPNSAA